MFEDGVKVVAVDYLQLATAGSRDSQHLALGDLARNLKHLARTHDGIVIGLAQLRNELVNQRRIIPDTRHIEYGTRLVQTADVCLLGFWPHKINSRKPEDLYEIYVGKNRNGEGGNGGACIRCKIDPARLQIMEGGSQFGVVERSHQTNRPVLRGFDEFNGQLRGVQAR